MMESTAVKKNATTIQPIPLLESQINAGKMTIDNSKDGLTEKHMEGLREYVKTLQAKKKLQMQFKVRHSRKVPQEDISQEGKGGVYEEGQGYLKMN